MTGGSDHGRHRCAWLALVAIAAALLAGCDTGHSIVVDNKASEEVLARLSGTVWIGASGESDRPISYVVVVPAKTRLVLAMVPFAGGEQIRVVEFLTTDCAPIGTFPDSYKGALFVVTDGLRVEQREEFPTGRATAQRTDACVVSDATRFERWRA